MKPMLEFSSRLSFGEAALTGSRESEASDEEFAALVSRQSRFVYRIAFSLLRNTYDAEDVTQESFLKIYRNGSWRGIEDERAFLAKVVWRMALDRIAKRVATPTTEELASALPSPEQLAVNANLDSAIHRLIDTLPEEFRQPLVLTAIEELTSRQIAQILGIPEGTVRRRVKQARQMLKAKMAAVNARGKYGK